MTNDPGIGNSMMNCILLLDDDQDDRDLFYEVVKMVNEDIKIFLLKDWEELFEKSFLSEAKPDAIFLDLNMPRKNGNECLRSIKQDPQLRDIPVIIYSTTINPNDLDVTFKEGAHFFLRKFNSYETMTLIMEKLIRNEIPMIKPVDKKQFVLK